MRFDLTTLYEYETKRVNTLKLGILFAIIWCLLSLSLAVFAYFSGRDLALVELDFRIVSSLFLLLAWVLDLQAHFEALIRIAGIGFSFSVRNVVISGLLGFVDGFIDGLLIGCMYNIFRNLRKTVEGFSILCFGVATGSVFGLSSLLLALVTYLYNWGSIGYGYNFRPISIFLLINDTLFNLGISGTSLMNSYLYFPKSYLGFLGWGLWGFLDGYIGGSIFAIIIYLLKRS